ncbi:MAG TPA: hypothetical protein VKW70_07720, partial [Terriglobia bacterium]|nr:hypothetical protein [Terriglobia bacterium]
MSGGTTPARRGGVVGGAPPQVRTGRAAHFSPFARAQASSGGLFLSPTDTATPSFERRPGFPDPSHQVRSATQPRRADSSNRHFSL